jgi:putative aldouronate transport system permease protein
MNKRTIKKLKDDKILYLMLLPAIIYFFLFNYLPIYEAKIAFQDYRFIGDNVWVGLKHFKLLFGSAAFMNVLLNTIIISSMKMVFFFPVPIILSLIINEVDHLGFRKYVQAVLYLPHFLSWVVIVGVFMTLLSPVNGAVNELIKMFGGSPISFLTDKSYIRWIFVWSEWWRSAGWDTILYVAALMRISPSLYEAARIDGAGRWQQMLNITLPELKSTIITVYILNLGFFMNAGFDQVFNFMNPSVLSTIDIIDTYVYRLGLLNSEFSYATAAGLFKGVVGLVLIMGSHYVAKKKNGKGLW